MLLLLEFRPIEMSHVGMCENTIVADALNRIIVSEDNKIASDGLSHLNMSWFVKSFTSPHLECAT